MKRQQQLAPATKRKIAGQLAGALPKKNGKKGSTAIPDALLRRAIRAIKGK